jgi:uncharacterized cupin superfamily protein
MSESDPVRLLLTASLSPPAEDYLLPADKLLAGNPKQTVWMHHASADGRFSVGVWRSEPGAWRIHYTEDEYCELLTGVSVVTDAAGHATTLRAGDTFVIPRGFAGTWEVVETTTKRFVIHEPGA